MDTPAVKEIDPNRGARGEFLPGNIAGLGAVHPPRKPLDDDVILANVEPPVGVPLADQHRWGQLRAQAAVRSRRKEAAEEIAKLEKRIAFTVAGCNSETEPDRKRLSELRWQDLLDSRGLANVYGATSSVTQERDKDVAELRRLFCQLEAAERFSTDCAGDCTPLGDVRRTEALLAVTDLKTKLYRAVMDADRQWSCAAFTSLPPRVRRIGNEV